MNRILIVCNTVLQIIFATNLKYTEYSEDQVTLIITDHTHNADSLVEKAQRTGAFEHVYFCKTSALTGSVAAIERTGLFGIIYDELNREKILKKYCSAPIDADILMAANPDKFISLLYDSLKKRNPDLHYYMYEDGLSAYCVLGETLIRQRHAHRSILHRALDIITRKYYASENIEALYLFEPRLCRWNDGIPFRSMRKMDRALKPFIRTLNQIFSYENIEDRYIQKYIFFEESYSVEKTDVHDLELVEQIASIVGKENIKIKIHPRNPVNRFRELGYDTNRNTVIPWEVIMLNEDFTDKVLLSIASGSIANPFLLMGIKTKSVVLMKCVDGNFGIRGNIYNKFLLEQVYLPNPDVFEIPSNIEDLKIILSHH